MITLFIMAPLLIVGIAAAVFLKQHELKSQALLRKYGKHLKGCSKKFHPGYAEPCPNWPKEPIVLHDPRWEPCDCGFDKLIGE